MPEAVHLSPFLTLPWPRGQILRLLGPKPSEAAIAVTLVARVDKPVTVLQSVVAGVCDADGRLVQPAEIDLVLDPSTVVTSKYVPAGAVVAAYEQAWEAQRAAGGDGIPTFEALCGGLGEPRRLAPLLFCRKSHTLFFARSPRTGEVLTRLQTVAPDQPLGNPELPRELLLSDGPASEGGDALVYGLAGGENALGRVQSLEELILAQPAVVQQALTLGASDAPAAVQRRTFEWCCQCEHCRQPDDLTGKYRASLDRLSVVHAADIPLAVRPLGEWRLREAGQIIGGRPPLEALGALPGEASEFDRWRQARAAACAASGPARLMSGENDGRDLLEAARLKLALMADVLAQLDAAWRLLKRAHLCWNDDTVRAAWQLPAGGAPVAWGFRPILRKAGWQPVWPLETCDNGPQSYPPVFSDPGLLPAEGADAARYWDESRTATVFVKKNAGGTSQANITILVEKLGIGWELFRPGDTLHVFGKGWRAVLTPSATRDPNDGEGLPFVGRATGTVDKLKVGEELAGCEVRWYARYGEAVDLHAFGMLLLEALLLTDQRGADEFRQAVAADRASLSEAALKLPVEQRAAFVQTWANDRAESDAPAAVWTRRNVFYRRDDRNATTLDAFPVTVWSAVLAYVLRLVTYIPGFSFCDDRTAAAPRLAGGGLTPLLELRGLTALLEDQLLGRGGPEKAIRAAFERED